MQAVPDTQTKTSQKINIARNLMIDALIRAYTQYMYHYLVP